MTDFLNKKLHYDLCAHAGVALTDVKLSLILYDPQVLLNLFMIKWGQEYIDSADTYCHPQRVQ